MPPIAKENEFLTPTPDANSRAAGNGVSTETEFKPQPVALEVPVNVNGARTVEGSDKREPFSESTKTVLVFGNGAVIRLSSSVAPGQLLFLTNEKTKKEVVCQVVKSKNYRNVSGYVELEFTESVVGFWGMRFPGDRIAPAPSPHSQAFGPPVAAGAPPVPRSNLPAKSAVPAPTAVVQPKPSEPKFMSPATPQAGSPAAVRPVAPAPSAFEAPRASNAQPSTFAPPPQAPAALSAIEALTFSSVAKPAAPVVPPPQAPVASNPETAALKQHTVRLQEQLSSLLFTEGAPAPQAVKAPATKVIAPAALPEPATKIQETAKAELVPTPMKPAGIPKLASLPGKSSLDEEELQVPSWLEPLGRNAAAPASTQELIEKEKAKHVAEQVKADKQVKVDKADDLFEEAVPLVADEHIQDLEASTFDNTESIEEELSTEESDSKGPGKRLLFAGIAAVVLLSLGGAWWYMRLSSNGGAASATAPVKPPIQAPAPSATVAGEKLPPQAGKTLEVSAPAQTNHAAHVDASAQTKPPQKGGRQAIANGSASAARNDNAAADSTNGSEEFLTLSSAEPAAPQPKKPALGGAAPANSGVTKSGGAQDSAEAEVALALNSEPSVSHSEALVTGLPVVNKEPVAPDAPIVPVGGDVKAARLLSSVKPGYPALAKSQHVSGSVIIDALIDANGRVTTMKVVSGPTLLHQAAMEALKQWKYEPAMLDGKAVPMHLTVTLQFRLQ